MKKRKISPRRAIKKRARISLPTWQSLGRRGQLMIGGLAFLFVLGLAAMFTGTQMENKNSFCASCHTEGEQTFFNQSIASAPVDLASYHELKGVSRCIDCHTGQGVVGRFFGLLAGSTDLVSFYSGHYPQPAVQEVPIPDENCLKCHSNISQTQDMTNHFHVFLPRWQAIDPNAATCAGCHNGHNTNGDTKIKYLNSTDTQAICQKCHNALGQG